MILKEIVDVLFIYELIVSCVVNGKYLEIMFGVFELCLFFLISIFLLEEDGEDVLIMMVKK